MDIEKFYARLLKEAKGVRDYMAEKGEPVSKREAAQGALDAAHTELSQRHFFGATDALGGTAAIKSRLIANL